MNQPFDEKLLADLRESPPDDFAQNLFQKLQKQEPEPMLSTASSTNQQNRILQLPIAATPLKIAAAIGFVLFLSMLIIALNIIKPNNDGDVNIESIADQVPTTASTQNQLSLSEIQRFGTGSLQKLVWTDNQRLVVISTTRIFIYDRFLNLQLEIDTETPATDAQINPHFRSLMAVVQNGNVVLMNIEEDEAQIDDEFQPSSGSYTQVHWLADGIRFVASNSDGSVDVFGIGGFLSHQVIVENVANTPNYGSPFVEAGVINIDVNFDGTQLVTVGADAVIKVWSIGGDGVLTLLAEMLPEFPIISYVTYAPNDGRLVIANDVLSLYEVDATGFSIRQSLALETPFNIYDFNISFDHSGDYVFFGAGSPPSQRVWHLPTDTTRTLAASAETEVVNLGGNPTYSPDGSMLATLGGDKIIALWNIYQVTDSSFLAEQVATASPVSGSFLHMAISSQNIVAAAQLDGTILLFDGNTGETLFESHMDALPNSLTFSPDGNMLVIFGFDTTSFRGTFYAAEVEDILNGTVSEKTNSHMLETGETYAGVAFNTDQSLMLTGGTSLRFWQFIDGVALQHPDYIELQETMLRNAELNSELNNQIGAIAFSPDDSLIAGMAGNILNVWDTQTGERRFSHYRRDFNQLILSFTADGQHIITSNTATDPALRFWNLNGEEVDAIPLPEGYLYTALSPDKSTLITVNSNGVHQRDIQDISAIGEPVNISPENLTLEPSNLTAIQVAYSGDGQHLLFRWLDGTLRLFEIEN